MARATSRCLAQSPYPAFDPDLVEKHAKPIQTPAMRGEYHADPCRAGTPESNREAHALLSRWARAGEWTEAVTFCRSWIGCSAYWRDGDVHGKSLRPGRAFHSGGAWGNRAVPVDRNILAAEREVALWQVLRPRLRLRWWSDSVRSLDDIPPDDCRAYILRIIYGGPTLESASTRAAKLSQGQERRGPGSVALSIKTDVAAEKERRVVYIRPDAIPLAQPLLDAFEAAWRDDPNVTLGEVALALWPGKGGNNPYRRREALRHARRLYAGWFPGCFGRSKTAGDGAVGSPCPARMRPMGVPYKVRLWFDSTDPMPFLRWTVGKPMERVVPGAAGRELGAPRRRHIAAFAGRLGIREADVRAWIAGDPPPEFDRQLSEEPERARARIAGAIEARPWLLPRRMLTQPVEQPAKWKLLAGSGFSAQYVPAHACCDWYASREAALVLELARTEEERGAYSPAALSVADALGRIREILRNLEGPDYIIPRDPAILYVRADAGGSGRVCRGPAWAVGAPASKTYPFETPNRSAAMSLERPDSVESILAPPNCVALCRSRTITGDNFP